MAATDFSTPAHAGGHLARAVLNVASRFVALVIAYRNRRAIAQLAMFDERLLRDIGVTAGDVRSAMAAPLSEDPSRHLAGLAFERRAAFRARAREELGRHAQGA